MHTYIQRYIRRTALKLVLLRAIVKNWVLTKLQSYLFDVPLEELDFLLLHWSEFRNWLVWTMRPPLRSKGGGG